MCVCKRQLLRARVCRREREEVRMRERVSVCMCVSEREDENVLRV